MSTKKVVEFDRLNALGKVVYAGGLVAAFAERAVNFVVDRASDLIDEAEHAFLEGLDGSVEDAKIVDEEIRPRLRDPRAQS